MSSCSSNWRVRRRRTTSGKSDAQYFAAMNSLQAARSFDQTKPLDAMQGRCISSCMHHVGVALHHCDSRLLGAKSLVLSRLPEVLLGPIRSEPQTPSREFVPPSPHHHCQRACTAESLQCSITCSNPRESAPQTVNSSSSSSFSIAVLYCFGPLRLDYDQIKAVAVMESNAW